MRTQPLILMMIGALAMAQPPAPAPGDADQGGQDPPGRAARLSVVDGTVSFQPGSVDDWVPATLNRPLTTGDRLWTDPDGRAEVHLGSTAMRLSARTNFAFINLDDKTAQVQLSVGTLNVRVRRLADDETVEVDTPQAALSLLRPGEYRIEVNEQGDTTIVGVRSGQVEATAGQAYTIQPRQQVRISGGADGAPPVFDQRDMPPADPFDLWCQDRDRREDTSVSGRYVSRDTPGYADLDQNGTWRPTPEYGEVWYPNVPAGWAPYHYGHWSWIAPWGWTWVDDAAWGYAPFHYGRWVFVGGAWAWVPGPMPGPGVAVARPIYAPALVAWVGGVGIGVGVGAGVGWFALGPREVFVPAYAYSPVYLERVNVTNTVIVNRGVFVNYNVGAAVYVNRGVVGAVTVVPGGVIAAGRPVAAAAIVVRPEMIAHAQVVGVAAVVPERGAVFGGRAVVVGRGVPPAMAMNRTVVTRMAPPPRPVAFDRQQAALRANPGHPLAPAETRNLQRSEPAAARTAYRPATAAPRENVRPAASSPARPTPSAQPNRPAPAAESRSAPPARGATKEDRNKNKKKAKREDKTERQ